MSAIEAEAARLDDEGREDEMMYRHGARVYRRVCERFCQSMSPPMENSREENSYFMRITELLTDQKVRSICRSLCCAYC